MSDSIVILCNGEFPKKPYPLYLLESAKAVVCCDGAFAKYLKKTGKLPSAVVGDMDSIPPALRRRFPNLLVEVNEQEDNDLTKAMRHVLKTYPEAGEIHILGAGGLREDHTIANYSLLMEYTRLFDLTDVKVDMVSDYSTAFAVSDSCELHLGEGRRVSIFTADNTLRIESRGLEWQTRDVVFDAWWKASLNKSTEPVVALKLSHPAPVLIITD